jgi:c-di-GMP-binding flagellar brake protein YcgR
MRERRKFVRAGMQSNIKWLKDVSGPEKDIGYNDVTKNIGGGGVCLITAEKLETGKRLLLEIELPTKEIIRSRGRVAWTHKFEFGGGKLDAGYEVGVEFLDINEHDQKLIEKFVFEYLEYPEKYK